MRWRSALALAAGLVAALALTGSAEEPLPGNLVGRYVWQEDHAEFGGFSAIELEPDGQGFIALTDRGFVARGRLLRKAGRITGVSLASLAPLDPGKAGDKRGNDAEGLATTSGGFFVSFEQTHALDFHTDGEIRRLPAHPDFRRFPPNGGIEALAIDGLGRLHALPERFRYGAAAPIYRFDGREWAIIHRLPRSKGFVPVGADFGPDGALYVLERAFSGYAFASRVRRLVETPGGWSESEVFRAPFGRHGNLEGIAAWRDDRGRIRLTMIADDNFHFLQRTEIVEYAIED